MPFVVHIIDMCLYFTSLEHLSDALVSICFNVGGGREVLGDVGSSLLWASARNIVECQALDLYALPNTPTPAPQYGYNPSCPHHLIPHYLHAVFYYAG